MLAGSAPYVGRRYELISLIGEGGMGAVFAARDRLNGRAIALKSIRHADYPSEESPDQDTQDVSPQGSIAESSPLISHEFSLQLRMALAREFHTLSSLRHPHIISVLDFGFDTLRRPFFTMELLVAPRTFTEAGQGLPLIGKLRLLAQLLRALIYLHRRGILHRDIKPSNILCDRGEVKVVDFGIATREKSTKDVAGTLEYMAPELLFGASPSTASDLYAVGVLAYELLTGRFPYSRDSVTKMLCGVLGDGTHSVLSDAAMLMVENYRLNSSAKDPTGNTASHPDTHEQLQLNGIPVPLVKLVRGLLSRQPAQRYKDAAVVLTELSAAMEEPFPEETTATRESFLQAAELVGRGNEVTQLVAALDLTFGGQGSAWLVGGESGVGKSRLLDEVRTLAMVRGAQVARGQAVNAGGAAYQVWQSALRLLCLEAAIDDLDAGVLRAAVPDIATLLARPVPEPPTLDPQSAQVRFLLVVEKLVLAQTGPLVLLLEDLHWAEPASLILFDRLLRCVARHPILLIGSYRHDERPSLLDELSGAQSLLLRRLSAQEVASLSVSILGEVGKRTDVLTLLEREAEGNALFIVEVLRALAEELGALGMIGSKPLPSQVAAGGVHAVLGRRLGRVSTTARPLLCAAAVLGRELELAVLRALPDAVGEHLDRDLAACAAVSVLEVQESRWRFTHDKLREALLAELSPLELARWHLSIGQAMERAYAANLDLYAAALGNHFDHGGELVRAIPYRIQAGENALRSGAVQESILQLERAKVLLGCVDATLAQRMRIQGLLCRAYLSAGRSLDGVQLLEQMFDAVGRPNPRSVSMLVLDIGRLAIRHTALRLRHGFDLPPKDHSDRSALGELADAFEVSGPALGANLAPEQVIQRILAWVAVAEELRDPARLAPAYNGLAGVLSITPLPWLSAEYFQRSRELAAQAPELPPSVRLRLRTMEAIVHIAFVIN